MSDTALCSPPLRPKRKLDLIDDVFTAGVAAVTAAAAAAAAAAATTTTTTATTITPTTPAMTPDPSSGASHPLSTTNPEAPTVIPEPTPAAGSWSARPSEWKLGESSTAAGKASPSCAKRPRTDSLVAPIAPRRTKSESSPHRRRRLSRTGENGAEHANLLFPGCPLSFNTDSPSVPSLQPPVNRTTLKDLELDSILRNPQLRHDLLFDSGLQFRPTSGRSKLDASPYWAALLQELETGCTCASFDYEHQPTTLLCACSQSPRAPSEPLLAFSRQYPVVTVRMPSRIKPLLTELLAVLLNIIQPLPPACAGVYMQEPTTGPVGARHQAVQHAAQAAALHAVLDPDLIVQEIEHKLFDPSGLFRVVGETLKCHCAPMRDQAVDAVIAAAQRCAPGAGGSYADAVVAMRLLFNVLETMKLDIANHQLQTLRPYLVQSSPEFELRLFEERFKGHDALARTRDWLKEPLEQLASANAPIHGAASVRFLDCMRGTQLRIATLKAVVHLVFDAVAVPDLALVFPETLHLDHARVHEIGAACADLTALYMHLMLFRQLALARAPACAACGCLPSAPAAVEPAEMSRAKRDTCELGPSKPGTMLWRPAGRTGTEREKARWERKTRAAALQSARRASALHICACATDADATPPQETVELAERWVLTHLRRGSPLAVLMRGRLRDAVLDVLMVALLRGGDSTTVSEAILALPSIHTNGLESLLQDIKHLADKIWRLANVHINVYGALYELPSFFDA